MLVVWYQKQPSFELFAVGDQSCSIELELGFTSHSRDEAIEVK
jgi:hypothetical protein